MTGARKEPKAAPGRADGLAERRCLRCGAVGTHYLTCPDLRLPSGYRVGDDAVPQRRVSRAR
jgi:hypothetical protein